MHGNLLKYSEAARFLGLTQGTLQTKVWNGTGPKPTYVGSRSVRFRMADLEEWLDQCQREHKRNRGTSDTGAGRRG